MSKSFNIDETVSVPILGYIQLVLNVSYSSTSGSYYKFEYLTSSFLSIEEDVQIQGSDCRCIPVYDAFSQIVNTISQGKLELSSSHLQKSGWILTSGLNLRGESAVINTSFDQLFEDIQKLECLKAAIDGNKLIIEPYGKMLSSIGMQISNESLINKMPFTDLLYNEIKAGCSNWKSDTPSGNEEVNAIATYTTGIKKIKQSCDLVLKY
ncbi:hypothetical protein ACFFJX_12680 [Pseudarcicella hirudinis]|uniref:hypothetical protein n=1 Tax=Pseudarcicella hirudinis TaxID=1079859 RepID=UPI0035E6F27C